MPEQTEISTQSREELRQRYAEALCDSQVQWWQTPPRLDFAADAVLAVRDEELQRVRAEYAKLRKFVEHGTHVTEGDWPKYLDARARVINAEAKLARLGKLHHLGVPEKTISTGFEGCCLADGMPWPCPTKRVLDGDS